MKGSKGLYVFTITEYENTDCLRIQIGGEEVYIPMRDIYGAAERHKQYEEAKTKIYAMPAPPMVSATTTSAATTYADQLLPRYAEPQTTVRILADSDAYVSKEMIKLVAERAISGIATRIRMQSGLR